MKWMDAVLGNGMRVQYKHDAFGTNVLYRGFWLHQRILDWVEVQVLMEKRFGRMEELLEADVAVFVEPDGSALIGIRK